MPEKREQTCFGQSTYTNLGNNPSAPELDRFLFFSYLLTEIAADFDLIHGRRVFVEPDVEHVQDEDHRGESATDPQREPHPMGHAVPEQLDRL